MKTTYFPAKLVLLAIFLSLAAVNSIEAQEPGSLFTVNDAGDSNDASPGDYICADAADRCTLRAAIEESNAGPVRKNAIVFDLPHPSVIELTLGELPISRPLEIVGPGARRLTIRRSVAAGTPSFRVFHVLEGRIILNIRGLTISNGNAAEGPGGALLADTESIVNITDVAITGNQANSGGGIATSGLLMVCAHFSIRMSRHKVVERY
jgi:CSLREA domain-containing protein